MLYISFCSQHTDSSCRKRSSCAIIDPKHILSQCTSVGCVKLHIRLIWVVYLHVPPTPIVFLLSWNREKSCHHYTPRQNKMANVVINCSKQEKLFCFSIIILALYYIIKRQRCLLQFYKGKDHMKLFQIQTEKKNWLQVSDFKAVFRCFWIIW